MSLAERYRRYGPFVAARCRKLLRDDALAEDALHEVFIRSMRAVSTHADDREFLAIVYRVSTNYCLDVLKHRQFEQLSESVTPAEASTGDVETALADRELLLKIFARCPEQLRAPALLHHLDGMAPQKIATILDCSKRTVFNRLRQFLGFARRTLERNALSDGRRVQP